MLIDFPRTPADRRRLAERHIRLIEEGEAYSPAEVWLRAGLGLVFFVLLGATIGLAAYALLIRYVIAVTLALDGLVTMVGGVAP